MSVSYTISTWQPEIATYFDRYRDWQIVICRCSNWTMTWFDLENMNDLVLLIANHMLEDHDSHYADVVQWVRENWT